MNPLKEDGGGRGDGVSPSPSPSPRVRLEVEFLDADQAAPATTSRPALEGRTCLTVLVVAAEADVRRYVRECLREHADLCLLEAATIAAAFTLASAYSPELLIVDDPHRIVLDTLSQIRAIVIVDDVPHGSPDSDARVRMLARPFTAEGLLAEVGRLRG